MYINIALQIYISLFSSSRILLSLPDCGQLGSFCLNHLDLTEDPVLNLQLKAKYLHCREKLWLTSLYKVKSKKVSTKHPASWAGASPVRFEELVVSDTIVCKTLWLKCRPFQKCLFLWVALQGSVVSQSAHAGWGLKRQRVSSSGDAAVVCFLWDQAYCHQ